MHKGYSRVSRALKTYNFGFQLQSMKFKKYGYGKFGLYLNIQTVPKTEDEFMLLYLSENFNYLISK